LPGTHRAPARKRWRMIGDSGRTPGADMVHGDLPDVGRHCLTKVPAGQVETGPPARQEHPASHLRSGRRSEEHTSELQSLMRIQYAVFCLKKKNTKIETN